jgi:hypothetical protein
MRKLSMSISSSLKVISRLLLVITAVLAILVSMTKPVRANSIPIGVYNGPGAVTAHNNFTGWLGASVLYATDYVDYKNGWATDFNPTWLIGPWGQWITQVPGRRLVLGLPMLENSNVGQFDAGAAGAFDSYFVGLAKSMVNNHLGGSVIRLGYEANCNTIGPWQATDNPAGYIKLFRHIVSVMHSVPSSAFSFDWTVCNGLQNGHALTSFASFYPGDDVVDIIGMDQYDVKWMDPSVTPEQRWQYNMTRYMGLQDHKNFALSHNKPVSFPEWGLYKAGDQFAGGGDDPYFIDQMANWFQVNNTAYQSYFNLNWGGGVLADFPNGQAKYKAVFGAAAPLVDKSVPVVTILSPGNGSITQSKTYISATASDNAKVVKMEIYIDGTLKKTTLTPSISYTWGTKQPGSHTISVKAYDPSGNVGQASVSIR